MSGKSIYRPKPVSGFPEWLPEERLAELKWMDTIRATFERYGFCSIETPSVEELPVLLAKGEVDKEIYTITRLADDETEGGKEARLGLHFDLTVPFARYTAQHFNSLTFPFKRYQMQRVWRGERPQDGRFREFYQCDIDVINVDSIPLHFDAELPAIAIECLRAIGVEDVVLHLSNRKLLEGYLRGLGIDDPIAAIRILDKVDKIGVEATQSELSARLGLDGALAGKATALTGIRAADRGFVEQVDALGVSHPLLDEGRDELAFVVDALSYLPKGSFEVDLSIARGFDYYTGTVYEGRFTRYPDYGSVVAGGRYDDLAGSYINRKLPGVGISIGLTRLFSKLLAEGRIDTTAKTPTDILVTLPNEDARGRVAETARILRGRGFNVETYHAPQKFSRQMSYADRKAIAYVWFPPAEAGGEHQVKDMASGDQAPADPESWTP